MNRIFILLGIVLATAVFSARSFAEDWTMFHGVSGNNMSTETGLLKSWGESGPKLAWSASGIGESSKVSSYGSVVTSQGRVFVAGNVEEDGKATATLYCLDEANGKQLWKAEIGDGWMGHYEGDRSTPTVSADRVYALAARGTLTCFDVASGKVIWKRDLAQDFAAKLPGWAYAESVVIDGENLIACPGGEKGAVVALNKKTGKDVWVTPPILNAEGNVELAAYATGKMITLDGKKVYVNANQKGFIFIDPQTGKFLGKHAHETAYDVNATMAYAIDDFLYLASGYATTGMQKVKMTWSDDKITCEQIWVTKKLDNQHGGLVFLDGHVYGSADKYKGGALVCLSLKDGEESWNTREVEKGSITFAEGLLYTYSEKEGEVVLSKAMPDGFEEISRFTIPQDGQGNFWAHPVISNGKLYLRRDTFLYCYTIK